MIAYTHIGMILWLDSVRDFLGRFGQVWLETFIMAPFFLLMFIVLTWPLKMIATRSRNYNTIARCRNWANIILLFMIGGLIYQVLFKNLWPEGSANPWIYARDMIHSFVISILLLVPAYQLAHKGLRQTPFYNEYHASYLKYFILFLRSFKDDEKYEKNEEKLMKSLSKLFHPYAIGKPDVLLPPQGAKRIYVGESWKEVVTDLQEKSPVILQRINMTDNFLWEFDQCVQHGYLNKVIYWVVDINDYDDFQAMLAEKYGLLFPRLFKSEEKEEFLFYKMPDGEFKILTLKGKKDYEQLADTYLQDHPELLDKNAEYFYGHNFSAWDILTRSKKDPLIPAGIEKWDWVACLFPQFFVLCHSVKQKWVLYIVIVILLMMINDLNLIGLLFFFSMLAMGQNGRSLAWLSHHWESREWFERCYERDNKSTKIFGIIFVVLQLAKAVAWVVL